MIALHNVNSTDGAWKKAPGYEAALFLAQIGTLGVNFFFVLSGFLITYLLLSEHGKTRRIDVRAFYIRRALRIWPLYFALVAVMYVARPNMALGASLPPLKYFLTFTANLAEMSNMNLPIEQQYTFQALGGLWSVCIEEQFYLAWPLLMSGLLAGALLARTVKKPVKKPTWFFTSVCLLCLLCRAKWAWSNSPGALYFHTVAVVGDLALGGWAAWNAFSNPRWPAWFERLPRRAIVGGYLLLLVAVAVDTAWKNVPWPTALNRPILAAGFAFVILEQCYARRSFYKCGRSRLLSRLGTYAYGLYCLQFFGLVPSDKWLIQRGLDTQLWQLFLLRLPLAFGLTLALAMLSYHLYEKPFLRLKRRFAHVQTT